MWRGGSGGVEGRVAAGRFEVAGGGGAAGAFPFGLALGGVPPALVGGPEGRIVGRDEDSRTTLSGVGFLNLEIDIRERQSGWIARRDLVV